MEIKLLISGWFLGIVSTLTATWLQAYLTRRQSHSHTLMETRLSTYGRLLSATKLEERYPPDPQVGLSEIERLLYNKKVSIWRKRRKELKGMATEALLLTINPQLKIKLSDFIANNNPEISLHGVEDLMRDEIGIR